MTTVTQRFEEMRLDFPILQRNLDSGRLVYLDSAATSLKPKAVLDAIAEYYFVCTGNVRRGVHALSEEASEKFDAARDRIARFINAEAMEVAFVRNATEAVNLVALSPAASRGVALGLGEHHSNLLPWRRGRILELPVDGLGRIDVERASRLVKEEKPGLIAFSSIGNALGVRQPVEALVRMAREAGARVLIDLSQSVGHEPVDLQALDCDYACFSGHKMLGPSGIGVLYARRGCEADLNPVNVGGSMVKSVHADGHVALPFPQCMEGGTPNIEGVLGLASACDYLDNAGLEEVRDHGNELIREFKRLVKAIGRIRVLAPEENGSPIATFTMNGVEAHAVARLLSNRFGIMSRSGYHCAQPLHQKLGLPETVRVSVHLYNTIDEIRHCAKALGTIAQLP